MVHFGGSIWPRDTTSIANPFPAARRAHAVILASLIGTPQTGTLHLIPGVAGVYPLDAVADGLQVRYPGVT